MHPLARNELDESLSQLIAAWRKMVHVLPSVDVSELPGLSMVWADVRMPIYNAMWITGPVAGSRDLHDRAQRAASYMHGKTQQGMLFVCSDYLPDDLRDNAGTILAQAGLHPAIPLTGMACDELLAPVRPLPEIEYRRVSAQQTVDAVSDINCQAYGFPLEFGRESMSDAALWDDSTFGYVGYVDDQPVATAATFPLDGRLYVALVATLPAAQRRGYAEAVMRYSLQAAARETGLSRTILHASDAGRPVYLRMGYRQTSAFTAYMLSHHSSAST